MNLQHQPKPKKFSAYRPICFCLEDISAEAPIFQFLGYPDEQGQGFSADDWITQISEWIYPNNQDVSGACVSGVNADAYASYIQARYNNWVQPNGDVMNKVTKLEGGTYRLKFSTAAVEGGITRPVRVRISFWRVKTKQLATQMLYADSIDPDDEGSVLFRKLGVEAFTLPSVLGTFSARMLTSNMRNFMYLKKIGGTQQFTIDATPGSKYPMDRWIKFSGPRKVINPRYVGGEAVVDPVRNGLHQRLPLGQRTWCVIETDAYDSANPLDLSEISSSYFPQVVFQRLVKWRDQTGGAQ